MPINYERQTYVNGSGATPLSAERLNHNEAGTKAAADAADVALGEIQGRLSEAALSTTIGEKIGADVADPDGLIPAKINAAVAEAVAESGADEAMIADYRARAVGSSRIATPYDPMKVMPKPPAVTFGGSGDLGGKTLVPLLRTVRVTTANGSAEVVAVEGTFSAADVGARVTSGSGAIPSGSNTTIIAVADATHATLSQNATGSTTAALVFAETSSKFTQLAGRPITGHSANGIAGTFGFPTGGGSIFIPPQWSIATEITNVSQFGIYAYSNPTDGNKLRVEIDRGFGWETISAEPIQLTLTASLVLTTVNLGAVSPKVSVRVDAFQGSPGIQGIYLLAAEIAAGATVGAYTPPKAPAMRMAGLGDSYLETGYGGATGVKTGWDNPASIAAKRLGFPRIENRGQGGTGWLNEGKGVRATNYRARDRVADLAALSPQPDILFIMLGENDASSSQAAVQAEVEYVLGQIATHLPFTRVYVIGAWGSTTINGLASVNAGIRAGCATRGISFADPLTGRIYDGAGALVHEGSAWLIPSDFTPDGIHVTNPASRKLGRRTADYYMRVTA